MIAGLMVVVGREWVGVVRVMERMVVFSLLGFLLEGVVFLLGKEVALEQARLECLRVEGVFLLGGSVTDRVRGRVMV